MSYGQDTGWDGQATSCPMYGISSGNILPAMCFAEHPGIGIQFTTDSRVNAHQFSFALSIERFRPTFRQQTSIHGTHDMANDFRIHNVSI